MKNLKKVLSLALAFAMVLGLCVTGFAAQDVTTLKDWDEVENKSAALLLNAFEIMQGDERGFRPDDTLTRAEAAKMISVALWGGRDDSALYAAGNAGNFTDLIYDWYKGYINYMAVNKIINGDPNGTFRPDDTVTGYELLKMCLTAIGYDPEKAGLTGTGWDLRAMSLATKRTSNKDLTDDVTVTNWNAPITRNNAAQVIANMVYRNVVKYDKEGVLVENEEQANTKTFGEAFLGMETRSGILIANAAGSTDAFTAKDDALDPAKENNALVETKLYKDGELVTDDKLSGKKALTLNSDIEDLGKPVTVYFADGKPVNAAITTGTAVEPKYNQTTSKYTNIIRGTADDEDAWTVTVIGDGTITQDSELKAAIEDPNTEVKCWSINNSKGNITLIQAYKLSPTTEIKSVATSEKYGEVYMTNTAAWSETRYEAQGNNIVKSGAVVESLRDFSGEKGDWATTCKTTNVYGQKFTHGYVLEAIEGKVTRKAADNTTVYIDGVKYANGMKNDEGTAAENFDIGAKGTFYIFNGSIVKSDAEGVGASNTYALVYDAGFETVGTSTTIGGGTKTVISVNAILPDGTNKTFEVAKVYKTTAEDAGPVYEAAAGADLFDNANKPTGWANTEGSVGKTLGSIHNTDAETDGANLLIPYTLTDDGKINLYVCDAVKTTVDAGTKVTNGVAKVGANMLLNSGSVTYYQTKAPSATEKETWVIYTGTSAPTYTVVAAEGEDAPANATVVANGTAIAYMAIANAATDETKSVGLYYLMSDPEVIGNNKYVVDAFSSDEGKVVSLEYTTNSNTAAKGDIYTAYTSAGFEDKVTPAISGTGTKTTNAGFITRNSDSVIVLTILETAAVVDTENTENNADAVVVSTVFTTNKDTKYYFIGDGEGYAMENADVTAQDTAAGVAAGDTIKQYQAVVVEAKNSEGAGTGAASIVVVFDAAKTIPND